MPQSAARPYIGAHLAGAHTLLGNGVFFAQDATNISDSGIKSFRIYFLLFLD